MEKTEQFEKERNLVKRLKHEERLNFRRIAERCGKSIYWVASRLDDKYIPSTSRTEQKFKDDIIIPFLKNKKHESISNNFKVSIPEMSLFISLLSKKKNIVYLYEVKTKTNLLQIYSLIGKLQISSYSYKKLNPNTSVVLNIVLPKTWKTYAYFTNSFLTYLEELNIRMLFL